MQTLKASQNQKHGVTARAQRENVEMQDAFYPISNPQATLNMFSQKTIKHIGEKFNHEIEKVSNQMLITAKKTKLGDQVIKEHQKLKGTARMAANLRGDLALVSLNQDMVNLEQLQKMKRTEASEQEFNDY